jgi:hypothetical protein
MLLMFEEVIIAHGVSAEGRLTYEALNVSRFDCKTGKESG